MHILHITLHNFRSFRQQGELPQGFSPGTNTIVGRNGSGKSNWLQAVQFCLGLGPFALLRQEERQALLHEGSGRAAVHAFVEVVLDNSQHRLAVPAATVTIRRTIGWKKDEFFLQRQRCTKQEITSLLEGAGFSKQNPYYIVQQGKVQALCTMSDLERLRLLQQVAGTVLYDEKKRDSVSHMNDNQGRLDKVHSLLQEMQDKLSELESEKEELQAYQRFDRQRRALSYALYEKECQKARRLLSQIEEERQTQLETLRQLDDNGRSMHNQIRNVESSILPVAHATYKRWTQQVQRARKQAAASKTALQTRQEKLRSTQEQLKQQQEEREASKAQAVLLQEKLQQVTRDLEEVQPELNVAKQALTALQQERTQIEDQVQGLYAKQGRAQQFETVAQRDAFLQVQIRSLQQQIASKLDGLAQQRQTLQQIAANKEKETEKTENLRAQIAQKSKHLAELAKSLEINKEQKMKLQNSRMKAWDQVENKNGELRQAQEAWHAAQTLSRQSTPRATAMGLQALPALVQELQLSNQEYFGTVLENFTLQKEKYQTCVEMAAQNALFHVIVDSDETASKLVQALERKKSGRVTFLPLNQLRPEQSDNRVANDNVRPLLSTCLEYEPAVEVAMQHVFGNKWLARTTDIAADVCRQYHVDVLTLEGDLCSRKGAMTGGYVDAQKSRIAAHKQSKIAQAGLQTAQEELEQAKGAVQSAQEEWQACHQTVERQTAQQKQLQHQREQLQTQLEASETNHESLERRSRQLSDVAKQEDETLKTEQAELVRLESEVGTALHTNLSEDDENLLRISKERLSTISNKELPRAQEAAGQLGLKEQKCRLSQKQISEQLEQLNGTASRKRLGNEDDDEEDDEQVDEEAILELQQAVDEAATQQAQAEAELKTAQSSLNQAKQKWTAAKQELEKLKQQDESISKALEEAREKAERLLNKRSMCFSNRETYMRKIQELGSLPPPSELEKYADKTISELMKLLESVNKKLKKYSHVNKKAFDQYVNFSEQREALLKRKEELDLGAAKVKELIESLDRQKDEAISRTFRGVSSHFRDVFKVLVPNGAGELIMRTAIDEEEASTGEEGSTQASSPQKPGSKVPDISSFRGIGIKVRFSAIGENYMMSQLSGGQKALVALALIFAIQRCDPAPFYMFDELDQALDSTYRAAVANVIQRQANDKENPTQFIVTTFRPELVAVSNRCFGVSHQNKVSSIHPLSKKDALRFVADLMKDEEAVGAVTATDASKTTNQSSVSSRKRKVKEALPPAESEEDEGENLEADDVADESAVQ
ncbi:hypothetical protein ACA910_012938 [Epithemia clementina (nom. ined.)]